MIIIYFIKLGGHEWNGFLFFCDVITKVASLECLCHMKVYKKNLRYCEKGHTGKARERTPEGSLSFLSYLPPINYQKLEKKYLFTVEQ